MFKCIEKVQYNVTRLFAEFESNQSDNLKTSCFIGLANMLSTSLYTNGLKIFSLYMISLCI